jgi:hypothetical protein
MNILRFKKPPPPQLPKIKSKRKPRLRIVASDRDVRLSKAELQSALNAWLRTLDGCSYICTDRSYIWISVDLTDKHYPALKYRVTRFSGEIRYVDGLIAVREVIGNILD